MTETKTRAEARLLYGLRLMLADAQDTFARFERNAQENCPLPDCTLEERETEARVAKKKLDAAIADFTSRFREPYRTVSQDGFEENYAFMEALFSAARPHKESTCHSNA